MNERLREEFNQWVLDGRSGNLEAHHRGFVEDTIPLLDLQPRDRILEIGCGEGWASRMLAPLVPEGVVVAVDIAEEMVRQSRAQSAGYENLLFLWADVEEIPWQENFFTRVLGVETFYYYENPEKVLRELYRVMSPGASVWLLNHLSKENELTLRWVPQWKVPVYMRNAEEYGQLFANCGFEGFSCRMIPDRTPASENPDSALQASPEELRRFRELGALLLSARKPAA